MIIPLPAVSRRRHVKPVVPLDPATHGAPTQPPPTTATPISVCSVVVASIPSHNRGLARPREDDETEAHHRQAIFAEHAAARMSPLTPPVDEMDGSGRRRSPWDAYAMGAWLILPHFGYNGRRRARDDDRLCLRSPLLRPSTKCVASSPAVLRERSIDGDALARPSAVRATEANGYR